MSKSPEDLLRHIQDEINFLIESSEDLSEEKFMYDETLKRAYARSIEIIGEASKNIPQDFLEKHQNVDWKSMKGMRDKLIHHYFGVDYSIVWDVVKTIIPDLKKKIDDMLE